MPGILDWLENTLLPALAESQSAFAFSFARPNNSCESRRIRATRPHRWPGRCSRLSALANAGKIRIQADPQPVEGIDPDNTYRVMVEALLTNQFKERVAMITQSMTLAEQLVQVAGSGAFTQLPKAASSILMATAGVAARLAAAHNGRCRGASSKPAPH